jgi:hypothetical protein
MRECWNVGMIEFLNHLIFEYNEIPPLQGLNYECMHERIPKSLVHVLFSINFSHSKRRPTLGTQS